MRVLDFSARGLFVFLICCILMVSGFYMFNFYGSELSNNPEQWGQLGDYFGGIMNPILGFITVYILIATIGIQSKQLKASQEELVLTREELKRAAEAATRQASHFEREAKLNEYLVLIDKLVVRINKNFNENRLDRERSLHGFVSSHLDTVDSSYVKSVLLYWNAQNATATRRIVWWVESDLKRLAELIKKYEIVSSGEKEKGHISPIPSFYRKEFGEMVSVLSFYGMLDSDVKNFFAPD
ncbi:hypothetical protein ACSEON_26890 [Pseudomonas aeruginosa]|nr:hypothetical protein [Pseudomonas aeruginosa]MCO4016273.1 hypothetical protein [Pseudomonas aeruginosa]HEH6380632.1 hypothetical protein [Pseudomonas aeruginosa]HEH6430812.1 hypothetical protein [Pseudomonas aeruginosa]HEH8420411.1 hypothetical protein [Pseudomonas aeruginosa]